MKNKSFVPTLIKVATVVASAPRWVLALMAADGFSVPSNLTWVHIVSGVFGGAMTILEGFAIAYILGVLAQASEKRSKTLTVLGFATMASFVILLAPSVMARLYSTSISEIVSTWVAWVWAIVVPMTTLLTVAAVGYAEVVKTQDALESEIVEQDRQIRELAEMRMREEKQVVAKKDLVLHSYDEFSSFMATGNGSRPRSAKELIRMTDKHPVTANRWWEKYQKEYEHEKNSNS